MRARPRWHILRAVFFCLLSPGLAWAQDREFVRLSEAEGLSNTTVYGMAEDRWGFLWVATRNGLNRFDGYGFRLYEPPSDGLIQHSQWMYALHADPGGDIWAGYRDGGILILDQRSETFRRFETPTPFPFDWERVTVRRFFTDSRGWRWLATNGQGAMVLDSAGRFLFRLGHAEGLESLFVVDFAEDGQGNIWIAASGRGIHCWSPQTRRVAQHHDRQPGSRDMDSFGKVLCWDPAGLLWVGSSGSGLYRYNPDSQQFAHIPLSSELVTGLACGPEGQLWAATDGGGLCQLDLTTGRLSVLRHDPEQPGSLSTDALYALLRDRGGQLWVGTFSGGLNLLRAQGRPIRHLRIAGARSVLALARQDSSLWAGSDGQGLFRLDLRGRVVEHLSARNSPLSGDVITSIEAGPDGWLWLGSFARGLTAYHPASGRFQTWRTRPGHPEGLNHDNVWDLGLDSAGGLWLGSLGGGLSYLRPQRDRFFHLVPEHEKPGSLSDWLVVDLLRSHDGLIWVATETQGLCCYDPRQKRMLRYPYEPKNPQGLSSSYLRCLFEDSAGNIWIGTEGRGLYCLDRAAQVFRRYARQEGLPSDVVDAINEDMSGYIWVSTARGLARLCPGEGIIRSYGREEGLPGNRFNPKSTLRLPDGTLLFGGSEGIAVLDPQQLEEAPFLPRVLLTGFRVFNEPVAGAQYRGRPLWSVPLNEAGACIRITHRENAFSFEFSAMHPAAPQQLRYAYRLRGFQPEWQQSDSRSRAAAFTNLEPGSYVFEVRAALAYGEWGPVRSIRLEIAPPFWKTWWFRLLMALAALAACAGLMIGLLQRERKAAQNRIREAEQEILRLQRDKLAQEVARKRERLDALLLQAAHKNEFLNKIKASIEAASDYASLRRQLLSAITQELREEDYWDQFQLNFDESHQEFIRQLRQRHPSLSPGDIRLSCFLRMHLSNREVASILNITLSGVEKGKFRLKQKLGLPRETDLNSYLIDL